MVRHGGRLIPLLIIPLWDAEPQRRGAATRRAARRGFSEIQPCSDFEHPHGDWDPFLL